METIKFNRDDYAHLVSDVCAGCGVWIQKSIVRYEQEGNYCKGCIVKVNARLKHKKLSEEQLNEIFRSSKQL